jgi:hypothetical protein
VRSVLADLAPQMARRAVAEERQAQALEAIDQKLGMLLRMDPELSAFLTPDLAEEEPDTAVEMISPEERAITQEQLDTYRQMRYARDGVWLDPEAAVEQFERDFNAAVERKLSDQRETRVEGPPS